MEGDVEGIVALNVRREPKVHWLRLRFECAEKSIPEDEDAPVIAIEIDRVPSVVHSVVGWRIEDPTKWPHGAHKLSMNPVLVNQVDGLRRENHLRRESQEGHGSPKDDACEHGGPWLPERRRQVVVGARVVVDVTGPQEANLMMRSMKPVVAKVLPYQQCGPHPPSVGQVEESVLVEKAVEGKNNPDHRNLRDETTDAHGQARKGVTYFVAVAVFASLRCAREEKLQKEERNEARNGVKNQLRHGADCVTASRYRPS